MHAVLKTEVESTLHLAQHILKDLITSWTFLLSYAHGKCVCVCVCVRAGSTVSWVRPRRRCRERGAWGRSWPGRKTCWPETLSASGSSWRFVPVSPSCATKLGRAFIYFPFYGGGILITIINNILFPFGISVEPLVDRSQPIFGVKPFVAFKTTAYGQIRDNTCVEW